MQSSTFLFLISCLMVFACSCNALFKGHTQGGSSEDLDITEDQSCTPTYSCVTEDNFVDLSKLLNKAVVRPKIFNIPRCVGSPDLEKKNQTCAPSAVKDLRVTVKTAPRRYVVETIPDLIIESCSIVNKTSNCTLEDRYVNLAEHLGLGELLIRPGRVNVHQCVGSKELESENKECVPCAYEPLDTTQFLEHIPGLYGVETIRDLVIKSCTVREKVPDIPDCELKSKTVNLQEYLNDGSIVAPESVDKGECVGSPDLDKDKECVPTSTKPIDIFRNNSGIDRLQDFVIEECSIMDKRNSCEVIDKVMRFNMGFYVRFSEIALPGELNVRQCSGGSSELVNQNRKCAPTSFEPTYVVLRNRFNGSLTIDMIDNFTIADCGIVPICELQDHWVDVQDLVDEEDCPWPVVFPAKANVGKCVRNPISGSIFYDGLQCTPTSYATSLLYMFKNDTLIFTEKPNVTISSCGPMKIGGGSRDQLW